MFSLHITPLLPLRAHGKNLPGFQYTSPRLTGTVVIHLAFQSNSAQCTWGGTQHLELQFTDNGGAGI